MTMPQITGYTDLHTHILPAVDDGAADMEETIRMLKKAYDEGVRTMFATPHYIPGGRGPSAEEILAVHGQVCEKACFPGLRILPGNEIYCRGNVIGDLKAGKALTLAGTDYVLTEFSVRSEYKDIFQWVRSLTEAGYRPVIAHAERYGCLARDAGLTSELIDAGAYIQINTESLEGKFWDARAAWCRKLLLRGSVHFLGSDCHHADFRAPRMRSVLDGLKKDGYKEQIHRIMRENVELLLENKWIR